MDQHRFDEITKVLVAGAASRRGVVRVLMGAVIGSALNRARPAMAQVGADGGVSTEASQGDPRCLPLGQRCQRDAGRECCEGAACKVRRCRCQPGFKPCGKERCIPVDRCCDDAGCLAGRECVDGRCRCPDGLKPCGDGYIDANLCCDDGDCLGDETCQGGGCACPEGTKAYGGRRCVDPATCCASGDCRCPAGLKACGDQCIDAAACCEDRDCDDDRICQDGSCNCPAGKVDIAGRCVPETSTCPIGHCVVFPTVDGEPACVSFPFNLCSAALTCNKNAQYRSDELCIDFGPDLCIEAIPRCVRVCPDQDSLAKGAGARKDRR